MRPGWFQIAVRFHVSFSLIVEFFPFKFFVVFYKLVADSVQQVSKKMCFFLVFGVIIIFYELVAVFMK
ncbi:hypothetical protein ES703_38417 [subsurface metagenome]